MRVITQQQVRDALEKVGVMPFNGSILADESYVAPSRAWLEGEFSESLQSYFTAMAVGRWLPEKNDCDNFSLMAVAHAGVLHARTNGAPESGLLFGWFAYVRDAGGGHAINFTLEPDGKYGWRPLFFEPQGPKVVTLSKREIESCLGYFV